MQELIANKKATKKCIFDFIFISVLMTGHSIIYACLLTAEKQTKIIGFSIIISVIINIIINIILVPNYGVFGSAYASAISFMIINILYCYNLRYKKLKYINDIQAILLYIMIIVLNNFLQSVIMNYLLLLCLKSIISSIAIIFLFAIFKINLTEIKTLLFKANIKNAII